MRFQTIENLSSLVKLIGAYFFGKRYPLSVTFISTYRCNFKCSYCNVWALKEREMSTQEVFRMVDELSAAGMRRIGFNGGESLLREDIGELVSYCKKKGLIVTLFTNGWLVEDKIEQIKDVDVLLVSFDGPAAVHDAQRQEGAYERVLSAVKTARGRGIRVWTNTVVTSANIRHLDFILDKARELDCETTFQPVLPYPHASGGDHMGELIPSPGEFRGAFEYLCSQKKQGAPIVHSYSVLKHMANPDWKKNPRRCWAGRLYCAVTPDGTVAPCYPIFNTRAWPNGLALGFANALRQIPAFTCGGCYCILAESDYFYSLKPEVLFNTARIMDIA